MKLKLKLSKTTCICLFLLLSNLVGAQKESKTDHGYQLSKTNDQYGKTETIHSKAMNRDLPVLVFLPKNYTQTKDSFKVVYLLHGVNSRPLTELGLREIYNEKTRVQEIATEFNVIIVTPITGNSFYIDSPHDSMHRFATYCAKEVPAYIDQHYRTIPNRKGRILAGFSMGGYGAVSLLCRYPDDFSVALGRAGALNPATGVEDLYWDDVFDGLTRHFGDYWISRELWHQNSCHNLINHVRERDDIAFVIEVGKEDFLYKTNRLFKERLDELDVAHIYAEYPGGHQWSAESLRSLLSHLQYFNRTIQYE